MAFPPAALPAEFRTKRDLKSVSDVAALLDETIKQARRGQLDVRIANTVGYLSTRFVEMSHLEVSSANKATGDISPKPTSRY